MSCELIFKQRYVVPKVQAILKHVLTTSLGLLEARFVAHAHVVADLGRGVLFSYFFLPFGWL